MTLKPPSMLIPFPMPMSMYIGRENSTAPKAKSERQKSLPAKSEAAYFGYDIGTYAVPHQPMLLTKMQITH